MSGDAETGRRGLAGTAALAGEPGARGSVAALAADLSALEETVNKVQQSQNKEEGDAECLPGPGATPNLENVLHEEATRERQTSPAPLVRGSERERAGSRRQEGERRSRGAGRRGRGAAILDAAVSVWDDEKVLEMDSGDGCTRL